MGSIPCWESLIVWRLDVLFIAEAPDSFHQTVKHDITLQTNSFFKRNLPSLIDQMSSIAFLKCVFILNEIFNHRQPTSGLLVG